LYDWLHRFECIRYSGEWAAGLKHGEGELSWTDGSYYKVLGPPAGSALRQFLAAFGLLDCALTTKE
jgi:hypothetical protein